VFEPTERVDMRLVISYWLKIKDFQTGNKKWNFPYRSFGMCENISKKSIIFLLYYWWYSRAICEVL